jgi:hypothetical protein
MKVFEPLSPEIEELARIIVDAAYKVHTTLGPGLLESVYETCLTHELRTRGYDVKTQVSIPIVYDAVRLEAGHEDRPSHQRSNHCGSESCERDESRFQGSDSNVSKADRTATRLLDQFQCLTNQEWIERVVL